MSGDAPDATGITQRELLLEMREDIRGLKYGISRDVWSALAIAITYTLQAA